MDRFNYEKAFAMRSAKCFFLIFMLMLTCILRVAVIISGDYEQVRAEQAGYRITISRLRGTIFDCNMVPLTNSSKRLVAAVAPTPRAAVGISGITDEAEVLRVKESIKKRLPTTCSAYKATEIDGIAYASVYERGSEPVAEHIIGYTDSSGHGASGLEAAFDSLLYSDSALEAVFDMNGKGMALEGIEPRFEGDTSVIGNGVVTTLDINIQNAAEQAMQGIELGAAVVAEINSGKIRAMVSLPRFDPNNIAASLEADNSPLINRALLGFSVGSVFKPCVAAAALENGVSGFFYNCEGKTYIIDRYFNCHKRDGHGTVNLKKALAFSCNSYFYNFAAKAGREALYNTASILSFGRRIKLCEGIYTASGNLTDVKKLENPASLANLSIGQGDLLLSPVSLLPLYLAIGGDGSYRLPTLTEATLKDGSMVESELPLPTRVMSEDTAKTLREALGAVVTEGTGTAAKPERVTAAGKTATAQTGRYDSSGAELTNSWFCGFFPADEPYYAVIVMAEGKTQKSTAAAFADIADGICSVTGAF